MRLLPGFLLLVTAVAQAQPAQDVFKLRQLPPPGQPPPAADLAQLDEGLRRLEGALLRLRQKPHPALPDVEVLARAVRVSVRDRTFYGPDDINAAKALLAEGLSRARSLTFGQTPWLEKPGPTVLGYVSALDGTVQPYGLYIPTKVTPGHAPVRLDAWFHGRDEKLTEVRFIRGVLRSGGPFAGPAAFTLQLYGRFCNASKFAGEVDFFEALADVQRRFPIDEDRIVVRGFSMGGASTWHLAAHHAWRWAAAAPGAGFAETRLYLGGRFNDKLAPTPWEETLWQLYDAPAYAENFRNVPLVAYSGQLDKQKQAADLMAEVLAGVGLRLTHVIGPNTGHSYHPQAKREIEQLVDQLATRGRPALPRRVSLATPTLRYNRQAWVTVDGLERHWHKATADAEIADQIRVTTKGVTALTLAWPTGRAPAPLAVVIDGQKLSPPAPASDRSWTASFRREGRRWVPGTPDGLRKKHGLQGPIDDAFMGPFLFVTPTGTARNKVIANWAAAEEARAIREWQRLFRGEVRRKRDVEVTDEDLRAYNVVAWGDPTSNALLAKLAGALPIKWTSEGVGRHGADRHVLLAIYPNPRAPERYLVLNSGFTFREYDYLTNARQTPKLPDWAVVDVSQPPDARAPGKIVEAGFFDERWQLTPASR